MTISEKKAALEKQRKKYDKAFVKWNDEMLEWDLTKKEKRIAYVESRKKTNKKRNPNRTCIYDTL